MSNQAIDLYNSMLQLGFLCGIILSMLIALIMKATNREARAFRSVETRLRRAELRLYDLEKDVDQALRDTTAEYHKSTEKPDPYAGITDSCLPGRD